MERWHGPGVYPDEFRERAVRLLREWREARGVAFPVPGHRPVLGLGRPLADHDLRADKALPVPWSGPSGPQRPPGAQARGELAAKSAAALDVQRLVDRLMRVRMESSSGKSARS